jgi:hypothetical protein
VPTVLLCSDSEMDISTSKIPFLEDLANLVQNGIVPQLFAGDDRRIITQGLDRYLDYHKAIIVLTIGSTTIKGGLKVTEEHVFDKFAQNIKQNLRIILCLKNTADNLRNIIRLQPSLVTGSTIDWYAPWPDEVLHTIAHHNLSGLEEVPGN